MPPVRLKMRMIDAIDAAATDEALAVTKSGIGTTALLACVTDSISSAFP